MSILATCPYNPGHRMPAAALPKHMAKCSDRPENACVGQAGTANGGTALNAGKRLGDVVPSSLAKRSRPNSTPMAQTRTSSTTLAHLSENTFDSIHCHPNILRSLHEVFKYTLMTHVQDSAIPACMQGGDVVAKAKTGTGKTLAFLIPALHKVLSGRPTAGAIHVLVMSPTRELAMQTAAEAKSLLTFSPGHSVQTVLGGTNMSAEVAAFKRQAPLVLVATPGRLTDHLSNSGLALLLASIQVLIFDEADQLLDMGFRPAIETILTQLPPRERRQTLLFSATFPPKLSAVTGFALKKKHQIVDCIGDTAEASNEHVAQQVLVCCFDQLLATVTAVLQDLASRPHKIIVFLPTAREAALFAGLFTSMALAGTEIFEIHSRMSQSARTRVSNGFRDETRGILFSSDVSARGMDYPDVTFVLQVGPPADSAQYLHRLGRTARAGKEGAGLLILCDFESFFLQTLKDLPLKKRAAPAAAVVEKAAGVAWDALQKLHAQNPSIGQQSYQAWLGQRKGFARQMGWSSADLVGWANYFATDILGLASVPALEAKTVAKMGLKGTPGIVIAGGGGRW
eukprot:TRINITY_DN43213_c0_g1_i1.p1 TRINITY_DN43213_c0_g1~~TRINITY_DN43213_c0_g1_i1.p1  ORF type:complete len:569 (+),score=87.89 TRINITY_DN43213_c0_g1_i1:50-1756(+)